MFQNKKLKRNVTYASAEVAQGRFALLIALYPPLEFRFTALPFELEKTSHRMRLFVKFNQAACFYCDVYDNKIVMF